jgi:hypothetical protein
MSDKAKKRARALQAQTGLSYQAVRNLMAMGLSDEAIAIRATLVQKDSAGREPMALDVGVDLGLGPDATARETYDGSK